MPLHLLAKKSWNVYNPTSVAKVRADERADEAREEAEDQRQDAYEAECRLAQLRGLPPPEPPQREPSPPRKRQRRDDDDGGRVGDRGRREEDLRKRRRLRGEDDTDRDIRYAQRDQERKRDRTGERPESKRSGGGEVALVDHAGHIQLFAPPSTKEIRAAKDAEVEYEKKRQESAEQGALKFSEAAGFKKDIKGSPWYSISRDYTGTEELDLRHTHGDELGGGKDAFGRDDPSRHKRDAARLTTTDPMAMMSRAQKKLKEVERERLNWQKEREKELKQLEEQQRQEQSRRHRMERRKYPEDDLENFRLDDLPRAKADKHESRSRRHHHRHNSPRRRHGESPERLPKTEKDTPRRHRSRSRDKHRSHASSRSRAP